MLRSLGVVGKFRMVGRTFSSKAVGDKPNFLGSAAEKKLITIAPFLRNIISGADNTTVRLKSRSMHEDELSVEVQFSKPLYPTSIDSSGEIDIASFIRTNIPQEERVSFDIMAFFDKNSKDRYGTIKGHLRFNLINKNLAYLMKEAEEAS
ncbi:MAG: hypothetical protein Harvfovirus36_10 [Harvfovirus sp.]|uniref:Uncharacterized protein n=1 Tax=Harvfovirus sp. TaxID=2487768 RepID=A0A3G5A7Q1_9VIRU|nr:MAG: hypothetical protein Harvfovirus36_10 [Harvfovirus sp.]